MNNLPKVVAQQRRGRVSNPRLLDRKSDALPLSHRATPIPHCRVLPLGEFTVIIPESHATLQGVRIPSAILKIVFGYILFYFFLFS